MGLLESFKKALGLTPRIILTEEQAALFEQLLRNRKAAAENVVPPDMRDEFVRIIFSDENLKKLIVDSAQFFAVERRGKYFEDLLRGSLSIGGFGRRLLVRGIEPATVFAVMFTGIQFPVKNESKTKRAAE